MLEQAPGRTCGERSPHWSRFAGRAGDPVGDPRWSSLFLKGYKPWKRPTLGQFVENCSQWERAMLEQFMEDCLLWEGPQTGAGEECEEEGAAEMCHELTASPIPVPLWRLGEGGRENRE